MRTAEDFRNTPMGEALYDLAREMHQRGIGPVTLNVIGGFAMMAHGLRDKNTITDIDYVGGALPAGLDELIAEAGRRHGMDQGWINRDTMGAGMSVSDFELSTGKLNFEPAFDIGSIEINVLRESDLLRLKIIAVDTAMAGLDASGSFDRTKDFPDVYNLMKSAGLDSRRALLKFKDHILCPAETGELLDGICRGGPAGGDAYIQKRQAEFEAARAGKKQSGSSSLLDAYMSSMLSGRPESIEKMLSGRREG